MVILGRRIDSYYCVLEAPDFVGRRSAEVLIDAGCKHPVILHGRSLTHTTSNRLEAFSRTVLDRTRRPATALVCEGLLPQQGAATIEAFLANGGKLDGLFAVTDSLAIGAYQAIKHSGRNIPTDVAVVGVGDYELAEYFDPTLTTVAGANDAMVAEAVPLLFRILRGENDAPREVLVVPPIFARGSTSKLRNSTWAG